MTLPTVNDVHVDAPLTSFSVRYMNNALDYVADRAFPIVRVNKQSDLFWTYAAGYWFRDEMVPRAPGDGYVEAGYGVSTDSYLCLQFALAKAIADEIRENADAPMDPDREASEFLAGKALLNRERKFSTRYMITGVWGTDNSSATDWDASGGVPITNMQVAKRAIKNSSGKSGNTLVMGKIVQDGLETNAEILGKIQYVGRVLPQDIRAVLAAALDVDNVHVGDAVYESAAEGLTSSLLPIIDDDALLIHTPDAPTIYSAAAGLTFVWNGGGGMGVVQRFRDEMNDRDVAKIKASYDQKKVAAGLGYFWSDIV